MGALPQLGCAPLCVVQNAGLVQSLILHYMMGYSTFCSEGSIKVTQTNRNTNVYMYVCIHVYVWECSATAAATGWKL